MISSLVAMPIQTQLEIKPWNPRPLVTLINLESPQSVKTVQVKVSKSIDDKIKKEVDNAVMAVRNQVIDGNTAG